MSDAPPRVSVALCTYEGARFVRQQVESILGQSPRPAQLIVSDDGSRDDTVAIVREVTTALPDAPETVVLVSETPLGVTKNFERAVSAASGDLIALSDQDDVWHEGRLASIAARFAADPALLLLHTDADLVDSAGEPLGRTLFESLEITAEEFAAEQSGRAFDAFVRRNLATGATVVFRRELLDAALPFPDGWVHDEWLAAVAAATGRVEVLREATIDYRQHDSNQIGVAKPSIASKVKRVLEPRGTRNQVLASRFATLADRLAGLGSAVPAEILAAARGKAEFEAERAALPAGRLRRAAGVRRLAASGRYERFASRGRADIIRDLLQPA
ncbi:glycosyltransferase family 2 protein [Leifsonia sp. NPDC058292]|uniref:glycosyltransferase family 2 protein n=1 Tax=Leifsonia sp. NPDC058292 TaxID=3346428 RepID=UPI0036D88BF3